MISKIKIWLQKYVLFQVNALISIIFRWFWKKKDYLQFRCIPSFSRTFKSYFRWSSQEWMTRRSSKHLKRRLTTGDSKLNSLNKSKISNLHVLLLLVIKLQQSYRGPWWSTKVLCFGMFCLDLIIFKSSAH